MVYPFMVSPPWGMKKSVKLIHESLHIKWWGLDDPLLLHYEFHPSLFAKGLFHPCWWLPQIVEIGVPRFTCSSPLPVTFDSSWSWCSIVDGCTIKWCILSIFFVGMVIWYFWFPIPIWWNMNASGYAGLLVQHLSPMLRWQQNAFCMWWIVSWWQCTFCM